MIGRLLLLLVGCGADVAASCDAYTAAVNTCYADHGAASGTDMTAAMLPDSYCDDTYGTSTDAAAADYLDCAAEVYAATDCADARAYAAIDLSACTGAQARRSPPR